jgi:hypothetical protein
MQEAVGSNPTTLTNFAPIAQLAERTAYTRRELRTGARLEVRLLLGVPPAFTREGGLRRSRGFGRQGRRGAGARRSGARKRADVADAIDLCPVAQWSRAPLSEGGGRAFESRRDSHLGRWCVVARNRSRKPGRPYGRGFDSFTFRQFLAGFGGQCRDPTCTMRVPLLPPVCKTGVCETGRSADERFESSGAHQRGRGSKVESLSATQGARVRFPPSAPIRLGS